MTTVQDVHDMIPKKAFTHGTNLPVRFFQTVDGKIYELDLDTMTLAVDSDGMLTLAVNFTN